ncbi:MAG TPA: hypothetical protein VGD66_10330 [Allosphingosinicella sp.]
MKSLLAISAATALALVATPAPAAGKSNDVSWGKPDIPFAVYQGDALECANRAYGVSVVPRPYGPVAFDSAVIPAAVSLNIDTRQAPIYTSTYIEGRHHALVLDTIEQLQAAVDSCLLEKGYSRFRLTPDQRSALRRLGKGSDARAQYLHRLGSDPRVLAAQAFRDG